MPTSLTVRLGGDPTPEQIHNVQETLRSLVTKFWLISQGRFDDLQEYDRTADVRFEQEAAEAGNSIELREGE